jgi:hypothetical protein
VAGSSKLKFRTGGITFPDNLSQFIFITRLQKFLGRKPQRTRPINPFLHYHLRKTKLVKPPCHRSGIILVKPVRNSAQRIPCFTRTFQAERTIETIERDLTAEIAGFNAINPADHFYPWTKQQDPSKPF